MDRTKTKNTSRRCARRARATRVGTVVVGALALVGGLAAIGARANDSTTVTMDDDAMMRAPERLGENVAVEERVVSSPTEALAMAEGRLSAAGVAKPPGPPRGHKKPYGDPKRGACEAREIRVQIQGISGDFCSPSCSVASPCPVDPYKGARARAMCVLKTPGSEKPNRCALVCNPHGEDERGGCPKGADCQSVGQVGICTYPQ